MKIMIRPTATVLLFDLDGTLVLTGGAGQRALLRALNEVTHRDDLLDFDLGGMTDPAIVRRALARAGLPPADAAETIQAVLARYVELLAGELQATTGYRVLPGVMPLLERLAALDDDRAAVVAVGLGTGNVRRGAELKLAHGGLLRFFGFGGFGSDAEERPAVLRIGAQRGAQRIGRPLAGCRVVVIGDTPRDVQAAHAIGAECLAVATGSHGVEPLRAAGATRVVQTLAEVASEELLSAGLLPR